MKKQEKTEEMDEKTVSVDAETQNSVENQEETVNGELDSEESDKENLNESTDSSSSENDELSEMKDKYLRLYSEFDNFRKRTAREKLDLINSANAELMSFLIPVLDDFERADKAAKEEEGPLKEGFDLIYSKYKKALDQAGLKEMEVGPGSEFDSDYHEAITQIPAPEESLKGKIVDVVEKGYVLKEKVIRFAKVVVGS